MIGTKASHPNRYTPDVNKMTRELESALSHGDPRESVGVGVTASPRESFTKYKERRFSNVRKSFFVFICDKGRIHRYNKRNSLKQFYQPFWLS